MSAPVGTVTVYCPSCAQPIAAPVYIDAAHRAVNQGKTLVIALSCSVAGHECEPPGDGSPLGEAA